MREGNKPINIIGMGIVCSIGTGVENFTKALKTGVSGIGRITDSLGNTTAGLGAVIKQFNMDEAVQYYEPYDIELIHKAVKAVKNMPEMYAVTVTACIEAWLADENRKNKIPAERKGIIVSGSNLMEEYYYSITKKHHNSAFVKAGSILQSMDAQFIGLLTELFPIRGWGSTAGAASASGNAAIINGVNLIRSGQLDWCMVVSPGSVFSSFTSNALYHLGALGGRSFLQEPQKACRPFDMLHEGFVQGQAAACIILEKSEAYTSEFAITGTGFLLHGSKLTEPSRDAEKEVMTMALKDADVAVQELDYINAHATSTPAGDIAETEAILQLLGRYSARTYVNSTKSLTGHCMYSAGLVEAIATVCQMKKSFVHPNLNLDYPINKEINFAGKESTETKIHKALSNSFGFNGINTSIVIEKNDKGES